MNSLDPKALAAAWSAYQQGLGTPHDKCLQAAITAYLAALPQSQDIRALVEELLDVRDENAGQLFQGEFNTLTKAAASLSCLAGEGWRPKVKPLDWHHQNRDDITRYFANPPFAEYIITWAASGYDLFIGFWGSAAEPRPRPFETLDAAKAAAQADYDRRILSALDLPAPSVEEKLP